MDNTKNDHSGFIFAKSFKEAITTNNSWLSEEDIKDKVSSSSKNVYETTYNRDEQYHFEYMKFGFIDRKAGIFLDFIERKGKKYIAISEKLIGLVKSKH